MSLFLRRPIRKFLHLDTADSPVPRLDRVGIDVVHGCQLRCVGCPNSTLHPRVNFMSPDDFDVILNNIDVRAIKNLGFFNFGEPLLHPGLPEILVRVKERSFPVIRSINISTNGQYHDFSMLEEIFKVDVLSAFAVSCDGDGTKEEYERLRPPGKFEKLIEFLTKAKALRDKYSPHTSLITNTICETNEGKRRWEGILVPLGWTPIFRNWYHFPESARSKAGKNPVVLKRGCKFVQGKYLFIDADGAVVPCCVHPKPFELGNLKIQKYSSILTGEKRRKKLRELHKNKRSMPVCNDCGY